MTPKVNAVANAYLILKCLADQKAPQGVTAIARETGISPSSTFNILKTLVELGLASFRKDTKRYELGLAIFELARNGVSNRQLLAEAQPILVSLAERYSGQSGLWEIIDGNRIIIAMGEAPTPARLNIHIGLNFPMGAGSAGRAFLARHCHDTERLRRAFDEVNWRGSISFEQYEADVKKAARLGYAIDRDKLYPGVTTISAAFLDEVTHREYCLSVFLLSPAHSQGSLKSIGEDVRASAMRLADLSSRATAAE